MAGRYHVACQPPAYTPTFWSTSKLPGASGSAAVRHGVPAFHDMPRVGRGIRHGLGADDDFNLDVLTIGDASVWCVLLLERKKKADGTICGLAVSFATLVSIFQVVWKQLG